MATHKISDETAEGAARTPAVDERIEDDDFSFAGNPEDKPKTGQELYRALVENGFIGARTNRTDIGESMEYAHLLRTRASERLRGQ